MTKLTIELNIDEGNEKYTPEQLAFIERHVFGNLAWLLENGGLGDMITPEIDWDNQEQADSLFGSEENDETMDAHMNAASLVIGYLDELYDVAIAGVASRGGTYVSMYEGGRNGVKVPEGLEEKDEMPIPTDTPIGVTNSSILESTDECALCEQKVEGAVMIGDELYHPECGMAMTRNVETTNVGSDQTSS